MSAYCLHQNHRSNNNHRHCHHHHYNNYKISLNFFVVVVALISLLTIHIVWNLISVQCHHPCPTRLTTNQTTSAAGMFVCWCVCVCVCLMWGMPTKICNPHYRTCVQRTCFFIIQDFVALIILNNTSGYHNLHILANYGGV